VMHTVRSHGDDVAESFLWQDIINALMQSSGEGGGDQNLRRV